MDTNSRRRWRLLDNSQESFSMLNAGEATFITDTLSYDGARRTKHFEGFYAETSCQATLSNAGA